MVKLLGLYLFVYFVAIFIHKVWISIYLNMFCCYALLHAASLSLSFSVLFQNWISTWIRTGGAGFHVGVTTAAFQLSPSFSSSFSIYLGQSSKVSCKTTQNDHRARSSLNTINRTVWSCAVYMFGKQQTIKPKVWSIGVILVSFNVTHIVQWLLCLCILLLNHNPVILIFILCNTNILPNTLMLAMYVCMFVSLFCPSKT